MQSFGMFKFEWNNKYKMNMVASSSFALQIGEDIENFATLFYVTSYNSMHIPKYTKTLSLN